MARIRVMRPEGDDEVYETNESPSLEDLQAFVGGYIERITANCVDGLHDLIVNEEGRLLHLPYNPKASEYAERPIVGTAVLFEEGCLE